MFDKQLRRIKDLIINRAAKRSAASFSPNIITTLAFLTGLILIFLLYRGLYLWGFGLWIVNRILDGLDGAIARINKKQTDFGGYYDILTDFVIYAGIPLALVLSDISVEKLLALAFLLAVFYINAASWMYLSAILEKRKNQNNKLTAVAMPSGIIEGAETIVFYALFMLFPSILIHLFYLMAILTILGVLLRFIWAGIKLNRNISKSRKTGK